MLKRIPKHYIAMVEERTQPSVGGGNDRFGGPDRYVAVQYIPPGVRPLRWLNEKHAAHRGIVLQVVGQGYSRRAQTERSMLGAARAEARRLANKHNNARR
jgi:hypothetical protein